MDCNIRFILYISQCIKFYVDIVSVGCRLNLQFKPNDPQGDEFIALGAAD
jgi:hypothetical protein